MQEKQEKGIMTGSAILGCLLTGYGMIEKNNVVFVIGWLEERIQESEVRIQKIGLRRSKNIDV